MMSLFLLLCTAAFAGLGFYLGHAIHDAAGRVLVSAGAGAAGGYSIGSAIVHVLRLWRLGHRHAPEG